VKDVVAIQGEQHPKLPIKFFAAVFAAVYTAIKALFRNQFQADSRIEIQSGETFIPCEFQTRMTIQMSKLIILETCQRKIPESIKYERVEISDPATTLPVCNRRKLDLQKVLTKHPMLSSII
jgi:hypothetical protein